MPIYNPEANSAAKARLIAALQQGRLIGMTGAGLSAWVGYPVWNGALRRLADLVAEITGDAQLPHSVHRVWSDAFTHIDYQPSRQTLGKPSDNQRFSAISKTIR